MSALDSSAQQCPAARRVTRGQCSTSSCEDHCGVCEGYANLGSSYQGRLGDRSQCLCVGSDCEGTSARDSRSCSGKPSACLDKMWPLSCDLYHTLCCASGASAKILISTSSATIFAASKELADATSSTPTLSVLLNRHVHLAAEAP